MKPIEKVLERLEGIERRNGGFMALCPSHDDHTPSLSISEGDGGKVLVRCFAGCETGEVLDALGLSMHDLFESGERNNGSRNVSSKPSAIWQVKDAAGEVQAVHIRFDRNGDKQVLWRLPGALGWGLEGWKLSTLPLYRSEHVEDWSEEMTVIVTEGEKATDALAGIYPPVVGTVTGADECPGREALEVLRGRSVTLWPDADDQGRRHMRRIATALQGIAREVRIFEWTEAPEKGDAADHPDVRSRSRRGARELLKGWSEAPIWEPGKVSSLSLAHRDDDSDDTKDSALVVKRFRDLPRFTGPRPYVVADLFPVRFPTTIYGDGGSAKSVLALSMLQALARGVENWLGHKIQRQMPGLYVDFELDEEEQSRRGLQLARGEGYEDSPDDLYYLCAAGRSTHEVLRAALSACENYGLEVVALDSVGIALEGDAESGRDVIGFFRTLDRFRAKGVSVLLVDHQSKLASGESYQGITAYGSVYKGNLSRSRIQVEAKDRGEGTLSVVLRQNKANFGALASPFRVKLTFSEEQITMQREELGEEELREERTLNSSDRVLLALRDGPTYPNNLVEPTGVKLGSVKNTLTGLRREGLIEDTGQQQGQAREVRLTDAGEQRISDYLDVRAQRHHRHCAYRGNDDDDAVARAAREDEELLRTGCIQSERQVL
jgi:DNA-binding MarR family transcriptional regulator